MFTLDVTVVDGNDHVNDVCLKFERNYNNGGIGGCNEVYLSPTHLRQLGEFIIRQSKEIDQRRKYEK